MRPLTVLTDIDHTMLGPGLDAQGVPEVVELHETLGNTVIPVTAKSIHEIIATAPILGLWRRKPVLAVAESGAAVYAEPGLLPWSDGVTSVEGVRLEYVKLYPRDLSLEHLSRIAEEAIEEAGCSERPVNVSRLDPSFLSRITGLPEELAWLIPRREHMLIYYTRDPACKNKIKEILEPMGYYVGIGRNFLHIGAHRGKGYATRWLLENLPQLRGTVSVGFGDTEPDKPMLEEVDIPVVIPPAEGNPLRLQRGDYHVAPYPAPHGWIYYNKIIILNL